MNKKLFVILGIICLGFFFRSTSCDSFIGTTSTSDSLEILVVREDGLNNLNFEQFKTYFFSPQKTITETEYTGDLYNIFNIIYINRKDFSEYFKGYKNIVFIAANNRFLIKEQQKNWGRDQTVLYFDIDSTAQENEIKNETEKVIKTIKDQEVERRIFHYKTKGKKEIKDFIQQEFGRSISLPNGFSIVNTMDKFIDVRRDFEEGTHRLIIQEISNKDCASKQLIINTMNQILEKNIHGEPEGSFAKIDDVYANVYEETINENGKEILEIRGLWKMKNDPAPMGGPFISYVLRGVEKSLLIGFYIWAPGDEKANHLIEAEAVGKSVFY